MGRPAPRGWPSGRPVAVGMALALVGAASLIVGGSSGASLARFLGPCAACAILFGAVARRDPVAFASIATVPFGLGAISAVTESMPLAVAALVLAFGWTAALVAGGRPLWTWWTRHVLRRTLPSAQHRFEVQFASAVRSYLRATGALGDPAPPFERARAVIARAHDDLDALTAPDEPWAYLRTRWLSLMATHLRDGAAPATIDGVELSAVLADLGEQQARLRGQETEWRGLHPTVLLD